MNEIKPINCSYAGHVIYLISITVACFTWSYEKTSALVNLYENTTCLWDVRCDDVVKNVERLCMHVKCCQNLLPLATDVAQRNNGTFSVYMLPTNVDSCTMALKVNENEPALALESIWSQKP